MFSNEVYGDNSKYHKHRRPKITKFNWRPGIDYDVPIKNRERHVKLVRTVRQMEDIPTTVTTFQVEGLPKELRLDDFDEDKIDEFKEIEEFRDKKKIFEDNKS